jgi:hypothetical protein
MSHTELGGDIFKFAACRTSFSNPLPQCITIDSHSITFLFVVMIGVVFTLALGIAAVGAFTPLVPTAGYTYTVEAARAQAWPSCAYRFLSYSADSTTVDLWNGAGGNQHWQFVDSGSGDGSFFLKTNYGTYLSYSSDCSSHVIDSSAEGGANQKFMFVVGDNTQFEYYIQAVGRSQCDYKYMSFPDDCTLPTV